MAQKRLEGAVFGSKSSPLDVVERIVLARHEGAGWTEIAKDLNAAEVPTAQRGKRWYASSVRAVALGPLTVRIADPGPDINRQDWLDLVATVDRCHYPDPTYTPPPVRGSITAVIRAEDWPAIVEEAALIDTPPGEEVRVEVEIRPAPRKAPRPAEALPV